MKQDEHKQWAGSNGVPCVTPDNAAPSYVTIVKIPDGSGGFTEGWWSGTDGAVKNK
jgi:hypothetical protein